MQNDFRKNGKLIVRCFGEQEQARLKDGLVKLGISFEETDREGTNNLALEINLQERTAQASAFQADAYPEDTRFYSAAEFLRLAELRFQTVP